MSNPEQAKALSAEGQATLDSVRQTAGKLVHSAAIWVYDMQLVHALATIAKRDKRIAAVEKIVAGCTCLCCKTVSRALKGKQ